MVSRWLIAVPALAVVAGIAAVVALVVGGDDQGRDTESDPGSLAQQWTFKVPDGYLTTVAAHDGRVFVAAAPQFPEYHPEARFVAMLDGRTGSERWRMELECVPLQPALDDERAYAACNDGTVKAWRHDGRLAWDIDTGGAPFLVLAAGELVIVADGDPDEDFWLAGVDPPRIPTATIRALDAATGALRWQVDAPDRSSLATLDGDVLYVTTAGSTAEGEVLALAVPDGRALWRKRGGWATGLPAIGPDLLYVGLPGGLTALRKWDGEVEWAIDAPNWRPVVVGEVVIAAGNSPYAIAGVRAHDGTSLWEVDYCDCGFHGTAFKGRLLVSGPVLTLVNPATGAPEWISETMAVGPPAIDGDWFFAPGRGLVTAFR